MHQGFEACQQFAEADGCFLEMHVVAEPPQAQKGTERLAPTSNHQQTENKQTSKPTIKQTTNN